MLGVPLSGALSDPKLERRAGVAWFSAPALEHTGASRWRRPESHSCVSEVFLGPSV